MIQERYPEIQQLSAEDKLALVSELWDDLEEHPSQVPMAKGELVTEINRRLEYFRAHPEIGSSWEDMKARILASRK